MDHFDKLKRQTSNIIYLAIIGAGVVAAGVYWAIVYLLSLSELLALPLAIAVAAIGGIFIARALAAIVLEPVQLIWQAVLHVNPDHTGTTPPKLDNARIGRELVTSLALQVYQLASQENKAEETVHRADMIQSASIVSHLPLPLFVFNKNLLVTNASNAALEYCQIESSKLFGKQLFDNLNLEFTSDFTLERWINECQQKKVTDHAYWERVRVRLPDDKDDSLRQCDMAAYYNRDNPSGTEFIVTIFDRTEQYNEDDSSMGFVALAVHELRTPLTVLRGYIEVFEEELADQLNPEMTDFLHKMQVSAKQLTAFVNNILNVARVDENQLTLRLEEENWESVLRSSTHDIELLAQVHGVTIQYNIEPDIPPVAVDRVSIYEVINNLLDNAIKYSGEAKKIYVTSHKSKDGMVETLVQDFGVGIPESVIPNLFERFHRNHRNRAQIAGTGLGLFLSKSIITAHGGNIWVKSKEGEGSTFGFTLQPYAGLADKLKTGDNKEITRNAHGWIKNHSMYRR